MVKHQYILKKKLKKHANLKQNQKFIFEFYIKEKNYKPTKHYFKKRRY